MEIVSLELGSKVKDEITGFKGIATARCEYLNGCVQYEITSSRLEDGEPQEHWFDEQRVILVGTVTKKKTSVEPPGGPGNHPTKTNPITLGR